MEQRDIHIKIPKEMYTKLKVKCAYEDISMQDYIARLVNDDMEGKAGRKRSVLIVDDEKIMRDSLKDWLKDGYKVTVAESGEDALDLIKKQNFDVMVIDVKLTGKSGLQVLKEVKELKPHIKSIIITAYPSIDLAVEAMKAGATDYLVKPFSLDQLEKLM